MVDEETGKTVEKDQKGRGYEVSSIRRSSRMSMSWRCGSW
jgi:hypothetical protein